MVIGASTGGVETLLQLVKTLPGDFPGSIFIVQHLAPYHKSELAPILNRAGSLKAVFPRDGDGIKKGHIYVAPPDHHLLVDNDKVMVAKGPKENRFRPSIDALFRSAAYTYRERVVGIVLTGGLDDGTSGLWSVKRLGGIAVVQDPAESICDSMPTSVLSQVEVDYVLPVADIGTLLQRLVQEPVQVTAQPDDRELALMAQELQIAAQKNAFHMGIIDVGEPTALTCPECHGALVALQEGNVKRYRCHTGHAFSSTSLLSEVTKKVEEDLWNTVRGLEETVMLLEQSGKQQEAEGRPGEAQRFFQKAHEVRERSAHIRELIFQQEQMSLELIAGQREDRA